MALKARYLKLFKNGKLLEKVKVANKELLECRLCPHQCGVNRYQNLGFCQASDQVVVSSYGPHFGEEKLLVGTKGSGTIFFSHCHLACVYCQNYQLSFYGQGKIVTISKLAQMMLELQNKFGCHNINLVSPSHYVPQIIQALYIAVTQGLTLPLVYNCGGYESVKTLKLLDGIIDIYLCDFKYSDDDLALKYSKVKAYPDYAKKALRVMQSQIKTCEINPNNNLVKGLLIRHLVLPNHLENTKHVLDIIEKDFKELALVNLMDQYYPCHQAFKFSEIAQSLSAFDYQKVLAYGKKLNLKLI